MAPSDAQDATDDRPAPGAVADTARGTGAETIRGTGAELLVCVKCRRGIDTPGEARRPGKVLADRVAGEMPEGLALREVECLSNCDRGCSVALRGPGRWTFVYGNFTEEDAGLLADGAARYALAPDGLVPWRERSEHFKRNCIARIPPADIDPALPETSNG